MAMSFQERALLIECALALASIAQYETRTSEATVASMEGHQRYTEYRRERLYLDAKGRPVVERGCELLSGEKIMRNLLLLAKEVGA